MPNTEKANADPWRHDPDYPVADWQQEVANDDTRQGYLAWAAHQRENSDGPYVLHVGNVGSLAFTYLTEAEQAFYDYRALSVEHLGRPGGETVELCNANNETILEYIPCT